MIKKTLKERASGLFLLFLASVVMVGVALNSQAKSQVMQNLADVSQASNDEQILGETTDNSEEAMNNSEEIDQPEGENNENANREDKEEQKEEEENKANTEDEYYNGLKGRLKKYCGKKNDIKKCKDYLTEAKDARNKGDRFKELYKKYHFEKKEEKTTSISPEVISNSVIKKIVVTNDGSTKSFDVAFASGASVTDLMKLAGITYSDNSTTCVGCIDDVNGMAKNSIYMNWMLYLCNSNGCDMAPEGASSCRVDGCQKSENDWKEINKIEWRYLDWRTLW